MHKSFFRSALIASALASMAAAFDCNHHYYIKSVRETVFEGSNPGDLKITSANTNLDKTMKGMQFINDSITYGFYTDFKDSGSCTTWSLNFPHITVRAKGTGGPLPYRDTTILIRYRTSAEPTTTVPLDFWYSLGAGPVANDTVPKKIGRIGRITGRSNLETWFGAASVRLDTTRTGVEGVRTHWAYTGNPLNRIDSADAWKAILAPLSGYVGNDSLKVTAKLQLIGIVYDTVPPPSSINGASASKASGPDLRVSRLGSLVLFHTGRPGEPRHPSPLGLFDTRGRRIASLFPVDSHYEWNGLTPAGDAAPEGLYLVRSADGMIGKFQYLR
jgi:hypothetical protein